MIRSVPSSSFAAPSTGGRAAEPVVLVGAGPGDPDLLTVRAARTIARADVILVDDLVDGRVLELARPDARVVHVGKRGGRASTSQAFIERLLIHEARSGRRVVRLKGGDPFVFGRGGEEVSALQRAGLDVEVIPGITAGIAAPAAVGIPVTDRRHAPGVAFVTGHTQPDGTGPRWDALARSGLTLVIYMGLTRSAEITAAVQSAGLSATTPAAVIQSACTPQQRFHLTTLAALAGDIERLGFAAPAILVIGDVVQVARTWNIEACVPADRVAAN